MPKMATKAADNVFYKARIAAASWNDRLGSREGASEVTGIDRTRLANIELGTINPHPEEVLMLSDTYNAPELQNHFCSHLCPLGIGTISPIELEELERVTLQLISARSRYRRSRTESSTSRPTASSTRKKSRAWSPVPRGTRRDNEQGSDLEAHLQKAIRKTGGVKSVGGEAERERRGGLHHREHPNQDLRRLLPDPDERRGQRNPRPRRTEDGRLAHGSRHT